MSEKIGIQDVDGKPISGRYVLRGRHSHCHRI
jgi:hypothetical protein